MTEFIKKVSLLEEMRHSNYKECLKLLSDWTHHEDDEKNVLFNAFKAINGLTRCDNPSLRQFKQETQDAVIITLRRIYKDDEKLEELIKILEAKYTTS